MASTAKRDLERNVFLLLILVTYSIALWFIFNAHIATHPAETLTRDIHHHAPRIKDVDACVCHNHTSTTAPTTSIGAVSVSLDNKQDALNAGTHHQASYSTRRNTSILDRLLGIELESNIRSELTPSKRYLPVITESFLRTSKSNIGNLQQFERVLHKLQSKQCLNILVFGGSISAGDSLDRAKGEKRWFEYFVMWLNAVYPCTHSTDNNVAEHRVISKAKGATAVDYVLNNYYQLITSDATMYDIIFAEWSNNDKVLGTDENIASHTEMFLRLTAQIPYQPMIIYLEMGWRDLTPRHNGQATKAPHFESAVFGHSKALFYYGITTISLFHALFPIYLHDHVTLSNTFDAFGGRQKSAWYNDCCHPNVDGHKVGALCIAYAFFSESQFAQSAANEYTEIEPTPISRNKPVDPWFITAEDEKKYDGVRHKPLTQFRFDSTQHFQAAAFQKVSNLNVSNWEFKEETVHHKWGLIATQIGSHLTVSISVKNYINIAYLKSYENIGSVAVWLDDENQDEHSSTEMRMQCQLRLRNKRVVDATAVEKHRLDVNGQEYVTINALDVSTKASVTVFRLVPISNPTQKQIEKSIHFCLPENKKFKLLSIVTS